MKIETEGMKLTPREFQDAVDALNLGGHPACAPYVVWDEDRGILIDGWLTVAEMRSLLAIIDPPNPLDELTRLSQEARMDL